jgi:hypothetical protein
MKKLVATFCAAILLCMAISILLINCMGEYKGYPQ